MIDDLAAFTVNETTMRDGRTLLNFDLESVLPHNAFIHNASLNLYSNPTPTVSTGHINNHPISSNNVDIEKIPKLNIEYSTPECKSLTVGIDNNYVLYISDYGGMRNQNLKG